MNLAEQSQLFQQLSNAVAAASINCELPSIQVSSGVPASLASSLSNSNIATFNGSGKGSQHSLEPNFASHLSIHNSNNSGSANSNRISSPLSPNSNGCTAKSGSPLLGSLFSNAASSASMSTLASSMVSSGKSSSPLPGQNSPKRAHSPVSRHQIELQLRQLQLEQQQIVQQLQLSSHRQYLLSKYIDSYSACQRHFFVFATLFVNCICSCFLSSFLPTFSRFFSAYY